MGAWSVSITGNDTAQDLLSEYTAAFFKYDTEEALSRIDTYVRRHMFNESDREEWCNYYYSLADFMWKKGILPQTVLNKAIEMIDGEFGLELWAESGAKVLKARKKKLEEFKAKLLSPMPPKKKIKPNVYLEKIFNPGDIVAVKLQTKGKPFAKSEKCGLSEQYFHALDGKYVLMQLIECLPSWESYIVPEVKDYWAHFRLFDGFYDTVPENINFKKLQDAKLSEDKNASSVFICESNMFYFKKRDFKVIDNQDKLVKGINPHTNNYVFWSINKPWSNPDSTIVQAMSEIET